jgi:transposase-like protein
MKYEHIKNYNDVKFRLVTGVKRPTFDKMIEILISKYAEEHSHNVRGRGRKSKLSMEDKLLATLEYLRENRTYAHIAASYGVSESNIVKSAKWIENTLIKDGTFSLPGKKALLSSDHEFEVIVIDVSESPVERPKKNSGGGIQGRKRNIQ